MPALAIHYKCSSISRNTVESGIFYRPRQDAVAHTRKNHSSHGEINYPTQEPTSKLVSRRTTAKLDCCIDLAGSELEPETETEAVAIEDAVKILLQGEHHLLPFYGVVVHIGYFCGDEFNPIGRSLLQSIVHSYGFKLQVQERLNKQIAETASLLLGADVMVVVEAELACMISRGIEKIGSSTATYPVLGRFATDSAATVAFLQSIPSTADYSSN